jgi:hypothetical protein
MQTRKSGRGHPRTLTLAPTRAHVNRLMKAADARYPPDDALQVEWLPDRNALRVTGNEFNLLRLRRLDLQARR